MKIDVFGPVAITTGIFRATFRVGDDQQSAATRTTVVFVDSDGDWLIAHEHHSPFVASS
jgi:ketosteroid isomerase-like protein